MRTQTVLNSTHFLTLSFAPEMPGGPLWLRISGLDYSRITVILSPSESKVISHVPREPPPCALDHTATRYLARQV